MNCKEEVCQSRKNLSCFSHCLLEKIDCKSSNRGNQEGRGRNLLKDPFFINVTAFRMILYELNLPDHSLIQIRTLNAVSVKEK